MAVTVLYSLLFPIALLLNGVAAWFSLRLRSTSTFMVYLKNLVAADLLMTLTIPIKIANDLRVVSLEFRMFFCRYSSVIFYSCMYTTITLLGLVSLDRFFKIIQPCGKSLAQNLIFGKFMAAMVWIILFGGTAIPTMVLSNRPLANMSEYISCMSLKGQDGLYLHEGIVFFMNVYFWLVSVLVAVCYICIAKKVIQSFRTSGSNNNQGKQKTKLRVFLVLIVFFMCFGPYHIVRIPYTLQQTKKVATCSHGWGKYAKEVSQWFAATNICLDPLLYFFLCREYREKLMSLLKHMRNSCQVVSGRRAEDTSP
ncbi:P2Y purinoceptor 13-like [Polymixia lowei]